jgi:hypothetical protein
LATKCFNRNNCPSLQWLGKNACLSTVVNAVMDKDSQNAIIDYNSKKFKLEELSEEANIEIVYDGKDEIVGINIILMEDVKIPIGQFLKNLKRFETINYRSVT